MSGSHSEGPLTLPPPYLLMVLFDSLGLRLDLVLPPEPPPPPDPPEPPPPPDPPEPPDLPAFSSSQICFVVGYVSLSIIQHFVLSFGYMPPPLSSLPLSQLLVLRSSPLITLALFLVPSGGTLFAFRQPFTAVCRLCTGLSPASVSTRQVMHLFCTFWNPIVSSFCLDCNRMSIVGKSLAFVRSFTAICSLFPDFVSVDYNSMSFMVSPALIYLRDIVNCLDCLCLGFRCLSYSFMEFSLLSISPLWEKCLDAGTISFFGDAILSPKDMRFEELQSHLVSKKPSLRRCSVSAFVVVGFFFPKFPLVSGLDDQDLSVLQGFSSRLIVPSTLVVEFVTFWVAMDAINQEAVEIILVCGSLMFSFYDLYLIYHSFTHPLLVLLALVALLLCISFVLVVIPPLFIEIEAF